MSDAITSFLAMLQNDFDSNDFSKVLSVLSKTNSVQNSVIIKNIFGRTYRYRLDSFAESLRILKTDKLKQIEEINNILRIVGMKNNESVISNIAGTFQLDEKTFAIYEIRKKEK
jgi:hypothetical protein